MDIARQKEIAQTVTAGKAVLGMEFGSTRIKAVLLDAHNRIIAQGHHLWENQMVDGLWSYSRDRRYAGLLCRLGSRCKGGLRRGADPSGRGGDQCHDARLFGL